MILVYILVGLLTVLYSCLIAYYAYHWNRIPVSEPTLPLNPQPVSIVIAARNEEKHVVSCVQSCLNQNYPPHLLEVIVVDDQSEDDTNDLLEAIEDPRFKLMRLGVYRRTTIKGSKKKALAYGIHHASGTIICTTDADCLVPPDWVRHMVSRFAEPQVRLVSGPVGIHHPEKAIHYFQALDFSANGLINGSGLQSGLHHLCNGANLAYRKSDFLEQDAFEDNYHIASGDDVFLMEKIRTRYPLGIRFAKAQEALVETHAAEGWSEFISQRLRWAGKMQLVRDWKLKCIPGLVWLQRSGTWSLLVFSGLVRDPVGLAVSGASLLVQWMADAGLQWKASRFYRIPRWSIWFLPMAVLHSFYFILLGLLTWLPVPLKWKGRRV